MKTARLDATNLTRTAGHGSFARAVFVGGLQQLDCARLSSERPMHQRCTNGYEDRSASPGAGTV